MQDFKKELLPIGSVVELDFSPRKLMIFGRAQKSDDSFWDYAACLFPIGNIQADQTIVFNRESIKSIYHLGYINDDEETLSKILYDEIEKVKKESTAKDKTE